MTNPRVLVLVVATLLPACSTQPDVPTRGRSDAAPTRTVQSRAVLYGDDGQPAGCADAGTVVTLDGNFFGIRTRWPMLSALSDGSKTAVWIYLPDASTCDGNANPANGHFVVGSGPIAPPIPPATTDRDTDRLRIRGLAIGGDDACTHGALDLHNIAQAGDDIAVVATGVDVGWKDGGSGDLSMAMSCVVTLNVQAQPGFYIQSFHGILTSGVSIGGDPAQAGSGRAGATASAGGSVGSVAIPSLVATGSSSLDADAGLVNLPLAAPATAETPFESGPDVQCAAGNGLTAVALDVDVSVTRDNVWLTPLGSFDAYDFAFLTLPCP